MIEVLLFIVAIFAIGSAITFTFSKDKAISAVAGVMFTVVAIILAVVIYNAVTPPSDYVQCKPDGITTLRGECP